MAFFAVVKSKGPDFRVIECHLNLWCLRGLIRPTFLFDVGLRLKIVSEGNLEEFKISIPFGTDVIEDLADRFEDQNLAMAIFGSRVDGSFPNLTYYKAPLNSGPVAQSVEITRIHPKKCEQDIDLSSKNYSCWTIVPATPLKHSETNYYLRFRFPVTDANSIWIWKTKWFSRYGAIFDFRVSDFRGASLGKDWNTFERNVVDIDSANLLLIAPTDFQSRATSPDFKYTRLFEGRLWIKYLDRLPGFKKSERFFVYHWKKKVISQADPFRVFLDLDRRSTVLPIVNHLLILVLFGVLLWCSYFVVFDESALRSLLVTTKQKYIPVLSVCVLFALAIRIIQQFKWFIKFWSGFRNQFKRFERWLFRMAGRISS
jgi:hypothetical protein